MKPKKKKKKKIILQSIDISDISPNFQNMLYKQLDVKLGNFGAIITDCPDVPDPIGST